MQRGINTEQGKKEALEDKSINEDLADMVVAYYFPGCTILS